MRDLKGLTERGMLLAREMERQGIRVIEIYPGGALVGGLFL